jgi:hypothetical protein
MVEGGVEETVETIIGLAAGATICQPPPDTLRKLP